MTFEEFSDALDEVPRTPRTLMVQGRGEIRHVPISALAEFRRRPRLERAQNLTALLGYLLEREENEQ